MRDDSVSERAAWRCFANCGRRMAEYPSTIPEMTLPRKQKKVARYLSEMKYFIFQ